MKYIIIYLHRATFYVASKELHNFDCAKFDFKEIQEVLEASKRLHKLALVDGEAHSLLTVAAAPDPLLVRQSKLFE